MRRSVFYLITAFALVVTFARIVLPLGFAAAVSYLCIRALVGC